MPLPELPAPAPYRVARHVAAWTHIGRPPPVAPTHHRAAGPNACTSSGGYDVHPARAPSRLPPISRHLIPRLIGLAVIVALAVVGLGAGFILPARSADAPGATSAPSGSAPAPTASIAAVASQTPAPSSVDRYLAPGGSDASGGTIDAPWATLAGAAARLAPGQTLWVRGGRYVLGETDWTASGAETAPITIRAYPGEQPVFDGNGSEDKFLWLHGGAAWIVLEDLHVLGYKTAETGVISVSDGAHDLTFRNVEIDGNRGGTTQDHLIYLAAPGVHDVTITGCVLAGASGAAIHVYHTPAATAIRITGNHIADAHWGVMLYSGTSDVVVSGNQFTNVDVAVRLERATNVSLLDNVASGTAGIQVVGPPVLAQYIDEGNTWPAPVQQVSP
jgi:hypothetical protein